MIPREILDVTIPILKQHRVIRASVFGSFARGTQRPESDLDLLVELPKGTSLFDLGGLYMDLKDALGRKVDVLTFNSKMHPIVQEKIRQEQVRIL